MSGCTATADAEAGGGGDDDGGDDGGSGGWFGGWDDELEGDSDDAASSRAVADSLWAWRCCLVLMVLQTVHFLALNGPDAVAGRALGGLADGGIGGIGLPVSTAARPQLATLSAAFFAPRARQGGLHSLPSR